MGLPELNIIFKQAADTAIKRSGSGICAIIIKDDTVSNATTDTYSFASETDVTASHFTKENLDYIKKAFLGHPGRVLVEKIATDGDVNVALGRLASKIFNYLACPDATGEEAKTIAEWLIAQRAKKKSFKAVLNYAGDNPGIIHFATEDIKTSSGATYTAAQYCCRIAGLLCGISVVDTDRISATYYKLTEVVSITESEDADADIKAGKLIIVNDGQVFKLGRAVNSLVNLKEGQKEELKKIRIIETMDLIADDIRTVYTENYVGNSNKYDNKVLFVNEVNQYYKKLAENGLLEEKYDNKAFISVDKTRAYLSQKGVDVSAMSENEIKTANTGSQMLMGSNIQIVDASEDLDMEIAM